MASMTLCRNPKCGKRYADNNDACPHCGRPNEETAPCQECGHEFAVVLAQCPHCATPRFPNVVMAEDAREREALERRYKKAVKEAAKRGAEARVTAFEVAASASKAVIARSLEETLRLAQSDNEGYATFYQLGRAQVRFPRGGRWDRLRDLADTALYGPFREHVRFAALSVDGLALPHYGEVSWVLRDRMIARRASVFEENSAILLERWRYKPKPGYRATWDRRSTLCVAKLAKKVEPSTPDDAFAGILMKPGPTAAEDDFVEVHAGGPLSIRTMEHVRVMTPDAGKRKDAAAALMERLERIEDLDVTAEEA